MRHAATSSLLACAAGLLVLQVVSAQSPLKRLTPDEMADGFLRRETERISKRFMAGATTLAAWQERRPRLRQEYFEMLGLWPLPEKTPLHATVTGTVDRGEVVIEKLHYQSRPGLYVTGNLYRPRESKGKLPAILYVCGHSGRGRDGNKTAFQDHGMWFARNGYVCLIVDTLQLGEVAGKHHGTYNLGRFWWQARGYTPAGVECWNGTRGIDYLISRPDVDPEKIGVTGISGGGASTIWIAAADERVKVAVPVSGMSDLESYVSHKVINGHCDCMLMVNTYAWEWTTIAALIAPRPLLFVNSDNDPIFPMDGNRRIIARLRQAYKLYERPELVDDYVSMGGHDYRPDLRKAVFGWINKHLKSERGPVEDATDPPLPGEKLRVFPEDKDIPADARNAVIDETFVATAAVKLPDRANHDRWRKHLLEELRARCFRALPAKVPEAAPFPFLDDSGAWWGSERWTQSYLCEQLEKDKAGKGAALLIVLNEEEDAGPAKGAPEWAKPIADGRAVRLLWPRGCGPVRWTRKSPPNYVERAHVLVGRTVDDGRVWDVIAIIKALQKEMKGERSWAVAGRGPAGIIAAYAALFEPSIQEVICVDPPRSHRDGPYFLNVLRVLDVPEALGLLAPRPLTLVGAGGKCFDRTAAIYDAAGAADHLRRK
jgi:cephalosporin-C deacetylase-like acetyl esterase